MESLDHVLRLTSGGRFGDALRALEEAKPSNSFRARAEVLRAELLERVGQSDPAFSLATALLKSKQLTASQRTECEVVLGRILLDEGHTERGLAHLQRAALAAQQAADPHTLFGTKLLLLLVLADRFGPAAGTSLLADVRQIATKLGDPEITTRLHLFVAQSEARRGLLENAKRHTSLARRILRTSPNTYLEAFTGNLELAIAVLRSEFDVARECGFCAVEFAEQSGAGKIRKAVFGNMGNLFYQLGDFDRAAKYFENALAVPPAKGPNTTAVLESLARIHLIQGRSDSCVAVLDRIESLVQVEQDRLPYEQRHSALTRIDLLCWQGRVEEALLRTDALLDIAARAGDGLLQKQTQLTKAELLLRVGRTPSSMAMIAEIVPGLVGESPELYAHSEQILACALASTGGSSGQAHRDRAFRIYKGIGSVPKQKELDRCWSESLNVQDCGNVFDRPTIQPAGEGVTIDSARLTLHGIATAFIHATRPDLIAAELVQVLVATGCTYSARATVQSANETEEIICESNSSEPCPDISERRLSVGFRGDREIQLLIRQKENVESVASINALTLLLASLHEVQRARAERED